MKINHDFHIHTVYSFDADVNANVGTYLEVAKKIGLKKLGFAKCIVPEACKRGLVPPDGLTVYFAKNVSSALQILF